MDVVLDRIRAALEVNKLRVETSQLRERLDNLSSEPVFSPTSAAPAGSDSNQASRQIRDTLSFLESFLDKRDQPPPPSIWARMVDMIEEHCRLLKRALQEVDKHSHRG
jgi:hypothetical protein